MLSTGVVASAASEDALDHGALEPMDVNNHEYVAYDAKGCLLDLSVIAVSRSAWFGLSRYYVDGVKIGPSEDLPGHAADLKNALSEFLPELSVSDSWIRTASLEELLDKTIHHVGDC